MHIEFAYRRSRKYFPRQLARGANEKTRWPRTIGQVPLVGAVSYLLATPGGMVVDLPREPLSPAEDTQLRALLDGLSRRAATPTVAEPLTGDRTTIEFTSSQPSQPVGTRLAALHRRRLRWPVFGHAVAVLAPLLILLMPRFEPDSTANTATADHYFE